MKSTSFAILAAIPISLFAMSALAQSSKDWVDVKNPKELRSLFSNKTFRGRAPLGNFVAHYRADGKGVLIWESGQRVPRTWAVKGNQVCVTDPQVTNCYEVQRNRKKRNDIVATQVRDRWISQFTVEDGVPQF
jgi:hypothetical protein